MMKLTRESNMIVPIAIIMMEQDLQVRQLLTMVLEPK